MNKLLTSRRLSTSLLIATLSTLGVASQVANAALPTTTTTGQSMQYGLINFSASANRKVDNDQINATMTKTVQNKSSAEVANQINLTLNQALQIAKKYPQVQVSTGNQNTYPQYDKNQKISGWTGSASLTLKSTDSVMASKLIADLQSTMTLDGLNFSVSDNTRKRIEQELMVEASKNFQNQATALLPVWQARDYQLVNLDFNQGGGYSPMPVMYARMANAESGAAKVADQQFQAGESTITVTANGVVQLVR